MLHVCLMIITPHKATIKIVWHISCRYLQSVDFFEPSNEAFILHIFLMHSKTIFFFRNLISGPYFFSISLKDIRGSV